MANRILEIAAEGWIRARALLSSMRRVMLIIMAMIGITAVEHLADGAWLLVLVDLGIIAYGVSAYRKLRYEGQQVNDIIKELTKST